MILHGLTVPGPGPAASDRPEAVDLLSADQQHVLDMYAQLMAHETPAEERETVAALCDAIETHLAAEEQILYPAVEPAPRLAHAANRNRASHAMIRAHIQHIRSEIRQHANHEDELRYLMADVERYFEDEASSLLAETRRYLPPGVRQQLGEEMARRWQSLAPAQPRRPLGGWRLRNSFRQHPVTFLLAAAGLALFTAVSLARRRQRSQVQGLPG